MQSGCIPDQYHHVTKRYSDFAALDSVLRGYGTDFSLPPKKVFGKMDSDFIEQRQRGLQVVIYSALLLVKVLLYINIIIYECFIHKLQFLNNIYNVVYIAVFLYVHVCINIGNAVYHSLHQ